MTIFKTRKNLAGLIERHNRLAEQHVELEYKFYGLIRSIRRVADGTTCEKHFERYSQTMAGFNNDEVEYIAALTKFAKFCKENKEKK